MKSWKKVATIATAAALALSACGGSSSNSSSDSTTAQRVKNAALEDPWSTPCASGGPCALGDTGPGGGTVFYSGDQTWNAVAGVSNGGVYMEFFNYTTDGAASRAPWGCYDGKTKAEVNPAVVGADSLAFGSGAQNTLDIVNGCKDEGIAAKIAYNYVRNGKDDWFLPSIYELNVFCQYIRGQAPTIDGKTSCDRNKPFIDKAPYGARNLGNYWSSTEANTIRAMQMDPTWKDQNNHKHYDGQILVVRSFGTYESTPMPNPRVYKCIYGGPCAVGETGPGGGTVFYTGTSVIDAYGDKYMGGKSLEFIDPFPTKKYKYRCAIHVNDTAKEVGYGAKNTALYRAACTDTGMPVELATNATNGGKSDWFIPSLDELNLLCRYLHGQSTTSNEQCNGKLKTNGTKNADVAQWSSYQYSKASMWGISFGDGTSIKRDKNDYSYNFFLVRATG